VQSFGPELGASAFYTHRTFSTATEASQRYISKHHMLVIYEYKEVLP
jgi:hypothetical protein